MAQERLTLENEVQEILSHIDTKRNFLLSGGAGSGKTFSLVQVIRQIIAENPTTKIACMTYTNAAVKEIEQRVDHSNLNVTTIHDFLWDNIKHFQKELRQAIIILANDEAVTKIKIEDLSPVPQDFFDHLDDGIQYKEYLRIREGVISHDELLLVANQMFATYPKLSDIVKDKYKFIFVDEYQDTDKSVVQIFLEYFRRSDRQSTIGFFGDAMQSIYDDGVGNLDAYLANADYNLIEVKKAQNRRNPLGIINLANRLRTDGISQQPSSDLKAPNMHNGQIKQGSVLFLNSNTGDLSQAKQYLSDAHGWNFADNDETKELDLTHNLIADQGGFKELMNIYDKDPIIKLKSDILAKIKDNRDRGRPEIPIEENDSFEDVVDRFALVNQQRRLKKDIILGEPISNALFAQLRNRPFSEVRKIYLNKDSLVDDKKQTEKEESRKGSKRDALIRHLFKIQHIIYLYQNKRFNEFLRLTDYRIKILSIADKQTLKENIDALSAVEEKTIEQIIFEADSTGICLVDDRLTAFFEKNDYLYGRVKEIRFSHFQKLYDYLEGKTPFSTQHKTKGREFENVLVVLNNGDWTKYNYEQLFIGGGSSSVLERTQKLFYVCCTRSKENLAVFYHNPSAQVVRRATEWFGAENVINL